MGIPTNQWVRYNFGILDDEGKWASDSDFLYLASGGLAMAASAVPEPSSVVMMITMALSTGVWFIRRRSR